MAARIVRILLICTTSVILRLVTAQDPDPASIGIQLLDEPKDLIVSKGKSAVFRCLAESSSALEIIWKHNGSQLTPNENTIIYPNGTLIIEKVKKRKEYSNGGTYQCLVKSKTSSAALLSRAASLKIAHISDFFSHPENTTCLEGETVRFSCQLDSEPAAEFTWVFQNFSIISESSTKYDLSVPGVLYIQDVQLSDQGKYRCRATNALHRKKFKESDDAMLVVRTVPSSTTNSNNIKFLSPPFPSFKTIREGENLILECAVSGNWDVTISWIFRRKNASGTSSDNVLNNIHGRFSILTKNDMKSENSGFYSCIVSHGSSFTLNKSIEISVITPPVITKRPVSIKIPLGRRARFSCDVNGHPEPMITWLHNGKPMKFEGHARMVANELVVSSTITSDDGIYQCVAINSFGDASAAAQLYINSSMKPPEPVDIFCKAINSSAVFVSWGLRNDKEIGGQPPVMVREDNDEDDDDGEALSSFNNYEQSDSLLVPFTITYFPTDGKGSGNTETTIAKSYVVNGLQASRNYTFYVKTWNGASGSEPSKRVICTTAVPEPASVRGRIRGGGIELDRIFPSSSPQEIHLSIKQIDPTSVRVSWNSEKPRILNDKYKIVYQRAESPPNSINVDFNQRSVNLYNLVPYQLYNVSLKIEVNGKEGFVDTQFFELPFTNSEESEPLSSPTVKDGVFEAPSSILLTWQCSDPRVSYYTIKYGKGTNKTIILNNPILVDKVKTTEYRLNNIEPDGEYTILLYSNDRNGRQSEPSAALIVDTETTNSDPPVENVRFQQLSDTSARILWTDPVFDESAPRQFYIVHSSQENSDSMPISATNNGSNYYVNVPDLRPNVKYSIIIHETTEGNNVVGKTSFILSHGDSNIDTRNPQNGGYEFAGIRLDEEQFTGVLIGIGISCIFFIICICTICICKRRFEKRRREETAKRSKILTSNYRDRINNGCVPNTSTQFPLLLQKNEFNNGNVGNGCGSENKKVRRDEIDGLLNPNPTMDETCFSVLDTTNERENEGGDSGYCDRNHSYSPVKKEYSSLRRQRRNSEITVDDGFYENDVQGNGSSPGESVRAI